MRPFDKPALTVEQQLELLKNRGLTVANDERATRFLEVVTLFRLSPYMRPFQEPGPDHKFKEGSSLREIVEIYRFDANLRHQVMAGIEKVEVAMRACLSNHMSPSYGADWFCDKSLFQRDYRHADLLKPLRDKIQNEKGKFERESDRIKTGTQTDIQKQARIESRMRDNYFRFYGQTYSGPELPPSWAVTEELSLGTISTLYGALARPADRKAIARRFGVAQEVLASWLHTLTFIRNCCAHHARLWNRELGVRPKLPNSWDIPLVPAGRPRPKDRVYIVLTVLAYLTDTVSPDSRWKAGLIALVENCRDDALQQMGFPDEWRNQPQWKAE
ncbi:TPA: Abi family protein [Pseudomonas aeruginosa]|nr:Abi family protein [Pseudomonas aeruginosa]